MMDASGSMAAQEVGALIGEKGALEDGFRQGPRTDSSPFGKMGKAKTRQRYYAPSIDIRLSLPLPFGRYHLNLVAGKERRRTDRLRTDRARHPLDTPANILFLTFIGLVSIAALAGIGHLMLADLFMRPGMRLLPF